MTVRTPHFGLEAFITGDVYSAAVDKKRFNIIDSHMAFISDLIGNGKILGWDISIPSPLTLVVSSGWGLINKSVVRTFGDYKRSILNNSEIFIWMRKRPGVIGQISSFSNIASINYVDDVPPLSPSSLRLVSKNADSIKISWDYSIGIDFEKFEIFRSNDNISYSLIGDTKEKSFVDPNLIENNVYYYKIRSCDFSGNKSAFTSGLYVVTDKDLNTPGNPGNFNIINSNRSIHITWDSSAYGNVKFYKAYITPITEEKIPVSSTFTQQVDSSSVDMTIKDLQNDQRYLIVLKSVTQWGIESTGVSKIGLPFQQDGPEDISEINVLDFLSNSNISNNGISITWDSNLNPYEIFDGNAEIKIEEYRNDGTIIVSDWISVIAGDTSRNLEVFSYKKNNQTFFKSIESRTVYYISVRNVDSNNKRSLGKRIKHFTKNFVPPDPVTSVTYSSGDDGSFIFKWENSPSIFKYNSIYIQRINLSDDSIETIKEKINIGKTTSYILDKEFFKINSRFIFKIRAVDEFENESSEQLISFDIGETSSFPKPPPPLQQIGFAGDYQNVLSWSPAKSDFIKGYRIYRAVDTAVISPENFTLIETVPSNYFTFTDYEVVNGQSYIYFITTIDIFGQESLNPIDDSYINYTLITLKPSSASLLNRPDNLTSIVAGETVQISWTPNGGQFDGYEIFRSIDNKYSYELIATVLPSITYYVDWTALSKTSKIYYIVRKFKNEADLYITESNVPVTNGLYLGKIKTNNGVSTVDSSLVRNISNLEDPVREESLFRINSHKHEWINDTNDNRINLSDKLYVSDWTTNDNQKFITQTDISQVSTYNIYVNGNEVSTYSLLFSLDKVEGSLTFEKPLSPTGFEVNESQSFLFETTPSISVEFSNLEEIKNILPKERFSNLSAQQVNSGFFEKQSIPLLNHNGRIKEPLIPIQLESFTIDDGYRFSISQDESLGDAMVFYDVIQSFANPDILVSSTSDGIYTSDNFGVSWDKRHEMLTPAIKFFYSKKYETYFSATNRGVLFGRGGESGGFSIWTEVPGVENAKIVRDIIEDSNGDVFCSTDLGVYKLRRDIGQGSFFFQQTPILGPSSSEAYALFYDKNRNRVIASNEIGIFETYNSGILWSFSDEFLDQKPIYDFAFSKDCIFAITDFMLWRRKLNDSIFERIGVMESSSISRKIKIWNNRIYISTDSGLIVSSFSSNIFEDNTISFENAFSSLGNLPCTSLNIIEDKLFVGSENKLFISEKVGKLNLHYEFKNNVTPTIYIDGEPQSIGYRFTTSSSKDRKFICFDVKQKIKSKITVANQYKKFRAKSGGWADTNFIASVSVFMNGNRLNSFSLSEKPAQKFSELDIPQYNDRNSHFVGAEEAKAAYEDSKNKLLKVKINQEGQITNLEGFTKKNVISTLFSIERLLSQIYENARVIDIADSNGNITQSAFKIPEMRVLLLSELSVSSFGVYKNWVNSVNNSQPSIIGNFGSELTSDGVLPVDLISGLGDLGVNGGSTLNEGQV